MTAIIRALMLAAVAATTVGAQQANRSRLRLITEYDAFALWQLSVAAGSTAPDREFDGPVVVMFVRTARSADRVYEAGDVVYLERGSFQRGLPITVNGPLQAVLVEPRHSSATYTDESVPAAFPRPEAEAILDNDRVRIWRYVLRDDTPMTLRRYGAYVTLWLDGGTVERQYREGTHTRDVQAGSMSTESRGSIQAERSLTGPIRAVCIEFK